jgi:hypothetical protein
MTLYDYKLLDEMKQVEVLWDKGVLLGNRRDEEKLGHRICQDQFLQLSPVQYWRRGQLKLIPDELNY